MHKHTHTHTHTHTLPTHTPDEVVDAWCSELVSKGRGAVAGLATAEPSWDGQALVRHLHYVVLPLATLPHPPHPVVAVHRDHLRLKPVVRQVNRVVLQGGTVYVR